MTEIIKVKELSKQYQDILAVDGISFTVSQGDIYGFLGQNGAGKSTTIRMLLTLVQPTHGEIEIFGLPLGRNRHDILKRIGAIVEKPDLYKYLSGLENLSIFAKMSGVRLNRKQLLDQMEMVGIGGRADQRVGAYSQGMKQRLGLAVALVHNPELIILDEPTNGLDPQGIADVRNLILSLSRDHHKTIFISSHLLAEVEQMANRMLILDKGKRVVEGSVKDLLDPNNIVLKVTVNNLSSIKEILETSPWNKYVERQITDQLLFRLSHAHVPDLTNALVQMGASITSITPMHSLEAYFLSLTNGNPYVDTAAN